MLRILLTGVTAAALLFGALSPAIAADKPAAASVAAAAPVQLLQPGDSQLGCDALLTQINALALAEATPATAPKKKKKGLGGLGKVLGMAAPMIAGPAMMLGGGMGGSLLSGAMGAAQQGASDAAMREVTDAAMAGITPPVQSIEAQRKARLMGFFEKKGC